jgi:uncharacterized protein (DUF2236 family)
VASKLLRGDGDDGLFGPSSIAWRVHTHHSMIVGGLRALLLQALEPRAMAAVDQHSNYRTEPWERLTRTSEFITLTIYGDTAAAMGAIKRVRAVHERVHGVDQYSGESYHANDPELLLWVHAAEVDSFLRAYQSFGSISERDADRYVAEMAIVAELLGVPRAMIPTSVRSLRRYLDDHRLVTTPLTKRALRFILFPPAQLPDGVLPPVPGAKLLLIPGRAGWSILTTAAIATLPGRVRRAYRLPWVPVTPPLKLAVAAMAKAMRRVLPPPPVVREAFERYRSFAA